MNVFGSSVVGVSADLLWHSAALVADTNNSEKDEAAHVAPVERINFGVCTSFQLVDDRELVVVVAEID
jgi:hypothetical protein